MDQADWYLHEQVVPTKFPVEPLDLGYAACATATLSMHLATIWPGILDDDYVLVQIAWSGGESADPTSLGADMDYIYWRRAADSSSGTKREQGPPCHWAGTFVADTDGSIRIARNSATEQICVKAWALRYVDKRIPVDYLYLSGYSYDSTTTRCVPMAATRYHEIGGMQVTNSGGRTNASRSAHFMTRMFGPTAGYSTNWSMFVETSAAANIYCNNTVWFDYLTGEEHEELTGTPLAGTATGGLRYWAGINVSESWVSASRASEMYLRVFDGSAGSMVRVYSHIENLAPGEYIFWAALGSGTGASTYVYMTAEGPDGIDKGNFYVWTGGPGPEISGAAGTASTAFDEAFLVTPLCSGLPNQSSAVLGGMFSVSSTGTYTLKIGLASETKDKTQAKLGQLYGNAGIGLNPANKSILSAYAFPQERRGISRLGIGAAAWGPYETGRRAHALTFQVTRRDAWIQPCSLISCWNPWVGPPTIRYTMAPRHKPFDDNVGYAQLDRWVFPRYYATNDAVSRTWGRYYLEFTVSDVYTLGALSGGSFAIMHCGAEPTGASLTEGNKLRISGNGDAHDNSMPGLTLTLSTTNFLNDGEVIGILIDYENSVIRVYTSGVEYVTGTMSARLRQEPMCVAFSPTNSAYIWLEKWTINTTGPFSYKPAGAVAYDWINEVA